MASPEPTLDNIVLEIIRSLQNEAHRWDDRSTLFRDDGLTFDTFTDYVWVYDDYRLIHAHGGENCRIVIQGKHNSVALKEAERLFKVRANIEKSPPRQAELERNIMDKLGL